MVDCRRFHRNAGGKNSRLVCVGTDWVGILSWWVCSDCGQWFKRKVDGDGKVRTRRIEEVSVPLLIRMEAGGQLALHFLEGVTLPPLRVNVPVREEVEA